MVNQNQGICIPAISTRRMVKLSISKDSCISYQYKYCPLEDLAIDIDKSILFILTS